MGNGVFVGKGVSALYPLIHLNWILTRFRGYGFKGLFLHSYLNFFAWVGLYFTTPLIVLLLWLRNRSTDPGPTSHDRRVPRLVRLVIGIVGGLTLLTSIISLPASGFLALTCSVRLENLLRAYCHKYLAQCHTYLAAFFTNIWQGCLLSHIFGSFFHKYLAGKTK